MPPEILWNIGLSAVLGLVSWILKNHADEVQASETGVN